MRVIHINHTQWTPIIKITLRKVSKNEMKKKMTVVTFDTKKTHFH